MVQVWGAFEGACVLCSATGNPRTAAGQIEVIGDEFDETRSAWRILAQGTRLKTVASLA